MYIPVKYKKYDHENYLFHCSFNKKKYIAKGQDKNNNRAERNDFAVFYNQIKCNLTQSFLQI